MLKHFQLTHSIEASTFFLLHETKYNAETIEHMCPKKNKKKTENLSIHISRCLNVMTLTPMPSIFHAITASHSPYAFKLFCIEQTHTRAQVYCLGKVVSPACHWN